MTLRTKLSPGALGLVLLIAGGCGTPTPTGQPSLDEHIAPTASPMTASPTAVPSPSQTGVSAVPSAVSPPPSQAIGRRPRFELGSVVQTVSPNLRVRAKPWVGSDSKRYEPLLPSATVLALRDGPIAGSGYWWYKVDLLDKSLRGGITTGWIAAAAHDGTPWIGALSDGGAEIDPVPDSAVPDDLPTPILSIDSTEVFVGADGDEYIRYSTSVTNWEAYSPELFTPAPDLEPCGDAGDGSRTWLTHFVSLRGREESLALFCSIMEPVGLTFTYFVLPTATTPEYVYVTLWDRVTGQEVESNLVRP